MMICITNHRTHADGKHHRVLILLGILLAATIFQARADILTDLEIDEQLSKLNKPSVKTIVTKHDVIDCVHIYKQPAFDHPLLKDHKIVTNPTFNGVIKNKSKNDSTEKLQQLWQKHGSCPEGTIPIKRVQRSDIIRTTSAETDSYEDCKILFAHAESAKLDNLNGLTGKIAVWQPKVKGHGWSMSAVTLQADGEGSFVRTGWMVNPGPNSDSEARLSIQWRNASSHTGCFNLMCPGFVQTSTSQALGAGLGPVSEYGEAEKYVVFSITKDDDNNWWVIVQDMFLLGYFPAGLMPDFSANKATWGGTVCKSTKDTYDAPEMGSGHFADEGPNKANGMWDLFVRLDGLNFGETELRRLVEGPNCYSIEDGDTENSEEGLSIYFGGPGGNC